MRVVMVVHSCFPDDPRVRKEAFALVSAGNEVEVVCLRATGEPHHDLSGSVRVHRLPVARDRSSGRIGYLTEYLLFFVLAAILLARLDAKRRIDVVHVHNIPDELVYCAFLQRLRGARIVLDLHDPMPELFADKYGAGGRAPFRRVLTRWQLASCRFADHVIVSSELFKDALVGRGVPEEKITVVINGPESAPHRAPFVVVYVGSVFERYGLETVIRGIALAAEELPSIELQAFMSDVDPACLHRLGELARGLGVAERVAFSSRIAPAAVRRQLATADVGIVPARRSPHIDLVYPTKLFDYLAAGLPVLAARTPPVERRFGDAIEYYEPDDPEQFAAALIRLASDRGDKAGVVARASQLPVELQWESIAPRAVQAIVG